MIASNGRSSPIMPFAEQARWPFGGRAVNRLRPHSKLGWQTPAAFAATYYRARIWRCATRMGPAGHPERTQKDKTWGQRQRVFARMSKVRL